MPVSYTIYHGDNYPKVSLCALVCASLGSPKTMNVYVHLKIIEKNRAGPISIKYCTRVGSKHGQVIGMRKTIPSHLRGRLIEDGDDLPMLPSGAGVSHVIISLDVSMTIYVCLLIM